MNVVGPESRSRDAPARCVGWRLTNGECSLGCGDRRALAVCLEPIVADGVWGLGRGDRRGQFAIAIRD